jgi:hypothetical protein
MQKQRQDGASDLLTLRLVSTTLRISVPAWFKRERELQPGDHVVWKQQPDGNVLLKFVKHADVAG